MTRGKYIIFEGIDGSGKGTQLQMFVEKLKLLKIPIHEAKEPTSNPIGKLIRDGYLSGTYKTNERVRQCLFVADRLDHTINPEYGLIHIIDNGTHVIQDRGYLSGLAYGSSSAPLEDIFKIHRINLDTLRPDVTVFIDLDPKISMERITKRGGTLEIYENLEKQKAIRDRYFKVMEILKNEGEQFHIFDGSVDERIIAERIWNNLLPMFA